MDLINYKETLKLQWKRKSCCFFYKCTVFIFLGLNENGTACPHNFFQTSQSKKNVRQNVSDVKTAVRDECTCCRLYLL